MTAYSHLPDWFPLRVSKKYKDNYGWIFWNKPHQFYVIMKESNKYFTARKKYKASRIFHDNWPWMIMAWDNNSIGRFIHGKFHGDFEIVGERR